MAYRKGAVEDMVTIATVKPSPDLWSGKRVFVTGHTGFKGGWLCLWLVRLGAKVCGYSLDPATTPNLFEAAELVRDLDDRRGDIRDASRLEAALSEFQPEVVFHLAAQPLVRLSYADPLLTFDTNVMGTARLLDAVRRTSSVRAVLVVTTDKCYENREWVWPYRECDGLGGHDPYSASKACAEIATAAFRQSYFPQERYAEHGVAVATARAGNVIGGGDWSPDRLVPDLLRGFLAGTPVPIRRPNAVRPWQHVLEPLHGYLLLAEHLLSPDAMRYAQPYNFGPAELDSRSVAFIADTLCREWGAGASWFADGQPGVHEAGQLKLDASRARVDLGWEPCLGLSRALKLTLDWHRAHAGKADIRTVSFGQIDLYTDASSSRSN